ncbi:MAG TPA: EVE domain-containing protein [Archaeoglobaceae archaeon]|nr:EVE domain-containing protein [Archaeoglobaceae archaeon]
MDQSTRRVSFEVVGMYWIFQSNPDRFYIIEWLKKYCNDPYQPDHWGVNRYVNKIKNGDTIFIWKAKGSENWRGIIAVAEVVDPPDENKASKILEEERDYWINKKDWGERRKLSSVWVRYRRIFPDNPLEDRELKAIEGLKDLHILRCPRGTVFKVEDQEGKTSENLIVSR